MSSRFDTQTVIRDTSSTCAGIGLGSIVITKQIVACITSSKGQVVLDNDQARKTVSKVITPVVNLLVRIKCTPDVITWIGGLGTLFSAVVFVSRGHFLLGAIFIGIFSLSDLLDGALARRLGLSGPWGAFMDSTVDRVSDAAVVGALAYYFLTPSVHVSSLIGIACLVALVMGQLTSYARARAEGIGIDCKVGIAERAERSLVLWIGMLATGLGFNVLPFAIYLLAAVSTITVGQRIAHVYQQTHQ